jgi:hypothetical protein
VNGATLGRNPQPNKGMELTAKSVRSFLAPAFGSSSYLTLDALEKRGHFTSKEVNSCTQG